MSQDLHAGASPNARFLAGETDAAKLDAKRAGHATLISIVVHGGFLLLALFAIAHPISPVSLVRNEPPSDIVWLDRPGPGGGGGGGGNRMPDPPRKAELKGIEKITVPVTKPPKMELTKPEPPNHQRRLRFRRSRPRSGSWNCPG